MPRRVECPRCEGDGQVSVNTLDELTVDDVLGVLDHEYVAVHLGHNWWVRRGSGAYELAVDCIGNEPVFVGAFVDCWREAKRRGLLG